MARLITDEKLGAWLLKCDPEANPELRHRVESPGAVVVRTWCVANTYRSRMMKPGDRAVLWISGNGRRLTRGIWGVGWVTGDIQQGRADAPPASLGDVPLDIPLFEKGAEVSSTALVGAGITDLEVQLQPRMSNPSWVTREQLSRMETLLGSWPAYVPPEQATGRR
ncbi:EVE domain-containing protein [Knoellia sp. Soil729]|uniref:EVE domain-containing protein n=1 Tax=Knoellia sp. Soil729 TaxID=1736394 RepID=UPI0006F33F0C|nr:EVE domain-containing protein [Knoellia sp. Soil729]KRE43712.1 hypothetical protein ASG74_02400 [Knoellia sp. Soil729]